MRNGNAIKVYRTSFKKKTKHIPVNENGNCPPRWRKRFNDDSKCVPSHKIIKESKIERHQRKVWNLNDDQIQSHIVCAEDEKPCQIRVETNDYGANQQWACCPKWGMEDTTAGDVDRSGR